MPRIRAPYEFNDGPINNNYRPVQIDTNAVTAPARGAQAVFQSVQEIVDHAADAANRNNAAADATQLEAELDRIGREMSAEAIPDNADPERWIREMPARFQARAAQARANIARARGMSATNRYNEYFRPQADQTMARANSAMSERSQARIIDWGRGAVIERAAILRARAMNPDLDQEARDAAADKVRETYNEAVRDGFFTRSQGEDTAGDFDRQYAEFNRGAALTSRVLRETARIRGAGGSVQEQLDAANQIDNLEVRDRVRGEIIQNAQIDHAAFAADTERYSQMAQHEIETNPAGWTSRLAPNVLDHLERAGVMSSLRADADNRLTNGLAGLDNTGTARTRLAESSYATTAFFRSLIERTAGRPALRTALIGMDLAAPLSANMARNMNAALGVNTFTEGMVISRQMTVEDFRELTASIESLRTGRIEQHGQNGPTTLMGGQIAQIVNLAADELGLSFEGDNAQERTADRAMFEAFVRNEITQLWGTDANGQPQYRPLTDAEQRQIAAAALRHPRVRSTFLGFAYGDVHEGTGEAFRQ